MRIGIDFDNTLVDYGALFHRAACGAGLIPPETPADKAAVKARIMHHGGGNQAWTELQGVVYGEAIRDARPFPGVHEFLDFCAGHRLPVSIVSHKCEYPALGPRYNLRQAARSWLRDQRITTPGPIAEDAVFFADNRSMKVQLITAARLNLFIDDLPEVFREPGFPQGLWRVLFQPGSVGEPVAGTDAVCGSWADITALVGARLA